MVGTAPPSRNRTHAPALPQSAPPPDSDESPAGPQQRHCIGGDVHAEPAVSDGDLHRAVLALCPPAYG